MQLFNDFVYLLPNICGCCFCFCRDYIISIHIMSMPCNALTQSTFLFLLHVEHSNPIAGREEDLVKNRSIDLIIGACTITNTYFMPLIHYVVRKIVKYIGI